MNDSSPDPSEPSPGSQDSNVPAASEPTHSPPIARVPGTGWPARLLLLGTAVIVFGPVVYHEAGPAEAAKWHLGAAREHDLSNRDDQALQSYEKAIDWHPQLWLIYQERARFFASRERHEEALADWDRSLEHFPFESRTRFGQRAVIMERGVELLHLDRYDEALKDAKKLLEISGASILEKITALNWIAYLRAVADRDLDTALSEVDEIFELLEERNLDTDLPSVIDTRAFILYRLGRFEEAKSEMDRALVFQKGVSARFRMSRERRREVLDAREGERDLVSSDRSLAVMLYHRGLMNEALGDEEKAARDYDEVRAMGFEPSPELF